MRPAPTDHSRNYKAGEARGVPGPGDYEGHMYNTVGSTSLEKFGRSSSWGFGTDKRHGNKVAKVTPGPGSYENDRGTAIHANYNNTVGGNTIEKVGQLQYGSKIWRYLEVKRQSWSRTV